MEKMKVSEVKRTGKTAPMALYHQGIRAKETREKYTRMLRLVLCDLFEDILEGSTLDERAADLVDRGRKDPEWARDLMLSLSEKVCTQTRLAPDDPEYINPSTVPGYFKPVRKLLDMNDVILPWKRISMTYPEHDNVTESRGWTLEEIQAMLRIANRPLERAMLLIMASSGIRMGGLELEWGDITPVNRQKDGTLGTEEGKLECAMLTVYSSTSARYPAFITPEAYRALQEYRVSWTAMQGREPRPKDPVFVAERSGRGKAHPLCLKKRLQRLVEKAGFRCNTRKGPRRFDVPLMNGFRRFWNKTCKEVKTDGSSLASLIRKEYMMGHSGLVKLDRNYFKTNMAELAEEYLRAVPGLTIGAEERLALENAAQKEQIHKLEDDKDRRIDALEKLVATMNKRLCRQGPGGNELKKKK